MASVHGGSASTDEQRTAATCTPGATEDPTCPVPAGIQSLGQDGGCPADLLLCSMTVRRPLGGSECWGPKFAILDPENESMAGPGGLRAFELAAATHAFVWSLGLEDTGVSAKKTAEKIA